MYEYFYGAQAEQFAFYRIPKVLFTDSEYVEMSLEAKLLYGLMLDRMCLSQRMGWFDEHNRVYIIFTVEDAMEAMNCKNKKALRIFAELEDKFGLIERKRQGLGKPSITYVKNFIHSPNFKKCENNTSRSAETTLQEVSKTHFKKCQNNTSGGVKITLQEVSKQHSNNTNNNNTEFIDTKISDTNLSIYPSDIHTGKDIAPNETEKDLMDEMDKMDDRYICKQKIKHNIEYDHLVNQYPYDIESIDEIVGLMVDTVCSNREYIAVSGDQKPQIAVKERLMMLRSDHITYCLQSLRENTTNVRNVRQYLLTTLYNASLTISNYYSLKVAHDMSRQQTRERR